MDGADAIVDRYLSTSDFTAKSITEHHQSLTRCGVTLSDDFIQRDVITITNLFSCTAIWPAAVSILFQPLNCST